jgi:hypothetical protein
MARSVRKMGGAAAIGLMITFLALNPGFYMSWLVDRALGWLRGVFGLAFLGP